MRCTPVRQRGTASSSSTSLSFRSISSRRRSAGTLQLGNGGTTGSIVGNVTNNGVLAFNRSDTFTFPSVISGSGSVSQIGPAAEVLLPPRPHHELLPKSTKRIAHVGPQKQSGSEKLGSKMVAENEKSPSFRGFFLLIIESPIRL
jgi:hypothetical protein